MPAPPPRGFGGRANGLRFRVLLLAALAVILVATGSPLTVGPTSAPTPAMPTESAPVHLSVADRPDLIPTPGGSVGSLLFKIHNPMSAATGTYQQMLRVNSSQYSTLINADWSNGVAFYTANGTPINGWIESNASQTAINTVLWLRLDSIAAGSTVDVSIYFWPMGSSNLSATGYMGEAPELSATYGEFDNGARVFNFYDDFTGSSLSSQWAVHGDWSYTVGDGFVYSSVPGDGDAIVSTSYYEYPAVVDFYGDLYQYNPASAYNGEGMSNGGDKAGDNSSAVGWAAQGNDNGPTPSTASGATTTDGTSVLATQQYAVFTTEAISTSDATFLLNYSDSQEITSSIPDGPIPVSLAYTGAPSGNLTDTQSTTWIRERSYVATMPTYSVSEVVAYPVTFDETGLPDGTVWWVNVTDGATATGTSASLALEEAAGEYNYTLAAAAAGYHGAGGQFNVTTGPVTVSVSFSYTPPPPPSYYNVTFVPRGLPYHTTWWVNLSASETSGLSPAETVLREENGSYWYNLSSDNPLYGATGAKFTVAGRPLVVDANFSLVPVLTASIDNATTSFLTCNFAPWTVAFAAIVENGTAPYTYAWNFGDGSPTGTGVAPTHTYNASGPFRVVLTVTDANGNETTAKSTVTAPSLLPCSTVSTLVGLAVLDLAIVLGAVIAVVVGVVVAVVVLRRRRSPPGPAPPGGGAVASYPPPPPPPPQ